MNGKEKLLAKFRKTPAPANAALPKGKDSLAALKELVAEGLILKIGPRYFLESSAPTRDREMARIDNKLRSGMKLFKENALHYAARLKLPTTRAALDELVDSRVILRLEIDKDKKSGLLYLHSSHAKSGSGQTPPALTPPSLTADPAGASSPAAAPPSSQPFPDPTPTIRQAYAALVQRHGTDSVFISELATQSGLTVPVLHQWLQTHVIAQGQGTLDEGDWSCASDHERAAAFLLRDRPRLYVRLHS